MTGDSWYASLENLKFLRNEKVGFLSGIANNRQVSIERGASIPVRDVDIPKDGLMVYLKAFGWVRVFCQPFKNEPRYYILYQLDLTTLQQLTYDNFKAIHDEHWKIEMCQPQCPHKHPFAAAEVVFLEAVFWAFIFSYRGFNRLLCIVLSYIRRNSDVKNLTFPELTSYLTCGAFSMCAESF